MGYKVLVIGAGLQGAAATSILSRDDEIEEVFLGDIDINIAKEVVSRISGGIIKPVKIDASNKEDVKDLAKRVDLILNMAPPRFNLTIMKAAVEEGVYYVDTACGPDLELNPIDTMVFKQLELNDEFRKRETGGLIACGYTPGLTDVVAKLLAKKFDELNFIKIRVGSKVFNKWIKPPISIIMNYSEILEPSWSPEVSFLYRASPPVIYKEGKYVRRELFGDMEKYKFPEPIGERWNVLVDHEEPVLIPKYIKKGVSYVDYKNQPDLVAYSLIKLGLASSKPVKIGNIEIVPRDVVLRVLKRPVHMFLEENEELYIQEDLPYVYEVIVVEVGGIEKGRQVLKKGVIKMSIPPADPEYRLKLFEKLGTLHINVALPAIVGGKIIIKNMIKGVVGPEILDAEKFLYEIKRYGVEFPIDIEKKYGLQY